MFVTAISDIVQNEARRFFWSGLAWLAYLPAYMGTLAILAPCITDTGQSICIQWGFKAHAE